MTLFQQFKTIDHTKTYDVPQLVGIHIDKHRQNYDYEVISKSIWDVNGNEYVSEEQALSKGVPKSNLMIEDDFIEDHVWITYRYERSYNDKINLVNAKKSGMGVIRMLQGELTGTDYMFCLYKSTDAINLLCYGYLTHGYIDKWLYKQVKKNEYLQDELMFIIGDFEGEKLYNEIMNFNEK